MKTKELIEHILTRDPVRQANYCPECKEYVEEPMMVCSYEGPNIVKVFHNDEPAKKLAKMLDIAIKALQFITTGHERTDEHHTAQYSNLMRLKAARHGAERVLEEIEKLTEKEDV